MNKDWYRGELQRISQENGGIPPGERQFYTKTRTKRSDWKHKSWNEWDNWGDVLEEFGYARGKPSVATDKGQILTQIAVLIGHLGRYPIDGDIIREKRRNREFPSRIAIRNIIGVRREVIASLAQFCRNKGEFLTILPIIERELAAEKEKSILQEESPAENGSDWGYVYLIRTVLGYKIGQTKAPYQRAFTIVNALPQGGELIHHFSTDDPSGIEKYWHTRFESKRIQRQNARDGEWFDLSAQDVKAFKRRMKFM